MKKLWWRMAISVLVIACFSGSVLAQVPAKEPAPVKKVTKMSVKGKIVYSNTMKRYVIRGRGEVYGIANQNGEMLGQLAKGKQTVAVEGYIVGGDLLFIEQIDGAPYKGIKEPGPK
jgi:hypothetical protein